MRANTDGDEEFRLDRAILVLRIVGLHRLFRRRIADLVFGLVQRREHLRRAAQDPHRLAAPIARHHLAGGKLAHVRIDRRPGRLRTL
jgi:hypothetical protein